MSGDQQARSFGDPNDQPPTPKQTPTSSIFASPVFETPKHNQGRFNESPGGWTPRFAEEYSVFNTTPGNLRGVNGPFGDFGQLTPYISQGPQPAGQKHPFSAEGIAAKIATHINHFSPNPNLPLPPVQPSQRLQSSPGQAATEFSQSTEEGTNQQSSSQGSTKKRRRHTIEEDSREEGQGQTVTPPPSARNSQRKLAPKLDLNAMQTDQGYSQQEFLNGTGQQQHNMGSFVTTPNDMFGYPLSAAPMSAPASEQGFGNQQFWTPDPNMSGMDIDYSGSAGADMYQAQNSAQNPTMEALEWARANHMFQQAGGVPQQNQENMQGPSNGERALASKAVMPPLDAGSDNQAMYAGSYSTEMENPFGIMSNAGSVNPGLLFSRPPSSSLTSEAFSQAAALPPSSSAPPAPQAQQYALPPPQPAQPRVTAAQRGELHRSMSSKELGPSGRVDRSIASSPTKTSRPGLSRSISESRGKKPAARPSLPALAPAAPRPQTGVPTHRPIAQAVRRTSPLKGDHHHRLSSLSSIPETAGLVARTRTQAKFTIDANGRARVETTVFVEDDLPPPLSVRKRNQSQPALRQHQAWHHSPAGSDEDSSSTDDEPIIIPSRNTSFALPDPLKATRTNPLHASQRSVSSGSYVSFGGQDDPDSEAETVVDNTTSTGGRVGDAASELKKLRESRHRMSPTKHKRFSSSGGGRRPVDGFAGGGYPRYNGTNPTSMAEGSLPTPSSLGGMGVRCLCNRNEVGGHEDGFMVQCESCEMWLHGRCVNISKRTVPSVYICLFCANTPNMRGGRIRDNGRVSMGAMGGQGHSTAPSPLAHKSFKSFR